MLLIRNNANCIALETRRCVARRNEKKKLLISSPTNIFAGIYSERARTEKKTESDEERERKVRGRPGWRPGRDRRQETVHTVSTYTRIYVYIQRIRRRIRRELVFSIVAAASASASARPPF